MRVEFAGFVGAKEGERSLFPERLSGEHDDLPVRLPSVRIVHGADSLTHLDPHV